MAAIGVTGYLLLAVLAWFRRRGWMLLLAWTGLGFAAYLPTSWPLFCGPGAHTDVISQCLIAVIAVLAAIDAGIAIANRIKGATDAVDQVVTGLRYGQRSACLHPQTQFPIMFR